MEGNLGDLIFNDSTFLCADTTNIHFNSSTRGHVIEVFVAVLQLFFRGNYKEI